MRPALIGSIALAVALAARVGSAQPREQAAVVRLEYDASAAGNSCPDESLLRNVVASHLGGREPFSTDGARRVAVQIRRKGASFVGVVVMYDEDGAPLGDAREVTEASCPTLVETIGTILLTWLVPVPRPRVPLPRPTRVEAPTPQELPPEPPPAPPPQPPSTRPRIEVDAGPLVSFATLPGRAAFGIAGSVGLRWSRFSLALGVRGELPSSTAVSTTPANVRASLMIGTLAPCFHWRWLLGCGLLVGGNFTLDGFGPLRAAHAYGAAGARFGAEIPLVPDRLATRLIGDVLVPFSPPSASAAGTSIWTAPNVGAAFGARLVVSF